MIKLDPKALDKADLEEMFHEETSDDYDLDDIAEYLKDDSDYFEAYHDNDD